MSLISSITATAAKQIQKDIDWHNGSAALIDIGWHKVKVSFNVIDTELKLWLKAHIKGVYYQYNCEWLFENADDATIFALRWL